MAQQRETIRIIADQRDLAIAIEGETGESLLNINAPRSTFEHQPSLDTLAVIAANEPDEYVISFEFDPDLWRKRDKTALNRLDIHVREITILVRDEGYVLEGDLSGWVGYTNAR